MRFIIFKSLVTTLSEDAIQVEIIKRPKCKPISKLKLDGSTYYISEDKTNLIAFEYKSYSKEKVKSQVIGSLFDKNKCKGVDYIDLERIYNDKINEFNGEEFVHSQYVTSSILCEIFKLLNKLQ